MNNYYQKKVSVIIPTYNRAKFISNAVRSIINQKYDNIEIIIVDDGSNDNTQAVIHSLKEKYSSIIYCHNERTKGPSGARNTGIIKSSGDYVSFLDSDDVWLAGHLVNGINVLNKHPEIDVLFGNFSFVDFRTHKHLNNFFDQMEILPTLKYERCSPNIKVLHDNLFKALVRENFFNFGTSIIRKPSTKGILLDESTMLAEDRDFVIQLFKKANATFAFRENPVSIVYKHDSSLTNTKDSNKAQQFIMAHLYLYTKYLKTYNLSKDEKRILTKLIARKYSNLSYLYGKNKEYQNALSFMMKSFKYGLTFRQLINLMKVIIILLIPNVYISKMRSLWNMIYNSENDVSHTF